MTGVGRKARWLRVVFCLFVLVLIWYASLLIRIQAFSSESYSSSVDVAVVLGAAAWDTHPSPVFEERIKHAINHYKVGVVRAIIFTGGAGEGARFAESEVARRYAIGQGVSGEHIYLETVSRITAENLMEAKKIIDQQDFTRIMIVSDPLHMKRAVTIARDMGIDAYPSPTPTSRYRTWRSKFGFLLREAYFYAGYLLRRPFVHHGV